MTVRGLELFGHHVNPILLLFVPASWLGAGPGFLLVVQVLVQASGAARGVPPRPGPVPHARGGRPIAGSRPHSAPRCS